MNDLNNMSFEEKRESAKNPSTPLDLLQDLAKDRDGNLPGFAKRVIETLYGDMV